MLAYLLAKRFTLLRIINSLVLRRLSHTHTTRGNVDPTQLKPIQNHLQALAFFFTNQLICWDSALIKDQLSRVDTLVAEFLKLSASAKVITFFNKK